MRKKDSILYFDNLIYEKKNRYKRPKENFKKLVQLLKNIKKKNDLKLLDVGCSNGELLYNLKKNFKKISLYGIDIDQNLLTKAKKKCSKDIKFKKGDIFKGIKGIGRFDIIVMSGVLGIFKDGKKIIRNLLKLKKKGGKIYIFDSFNIYPCNLQVRSEELKKGFKSRILYKNMYSLQFIRQTCKKFKKKMIIYPFLLKTNLKRDGKNITYAWTEFLSKKKIVTSGLSLIQRQFWIKIY